MKRKVILLSAVILTVLVSVNAILPDLLTPSMVREMRDLTEGLEPPEGEVLEDVSYRKRLFGGDAALDIYYPLESAAELYGSYDSGLAPVLVFFHGGSWLHGDRKMIRIVDPFLHKLRSRGIAVVSVGYTAGLAGGLREPVRNCREALLWLRERGADYGLNPRAAGLYGVSAGAHLALMSVPDAVADPGLDLRFVLEEFGPVDLTAMAEGDAFDFSSSLALFPSSFLEKYSPVRYVASDWPPVLMFHGTGDTLVSIRQTELLARTLKEKGVPHAFHVVPGGDHGFFNKSGEFWGELEDRCLAFVMPLYFPGEPVGGF